MKNLAEAMKYVQLGVSDLKMPIVGLGTWRAKPEEIESAVTIALDAGYRHIDTAFNYGTEESIGKVINKWIADGKGKREDLFITTKLPNFANRPRDVERFMKLSLERLQLNYVDLYLVHMPFSFYCNEETLSPLFLENGTVSLDCKENLFGVWQKMEEQVEAGRTKAIGVSNFNIEQIERIYNKAKIKPAVLQVEMHAYLQQKEVVTFCKKMNIVVTAYSPLGSPGANKHFSDKYNYIIDDFPDILGQEVVKELAIKYQKTPGQILLRHLIQQDIVVIPKSGNSERIKSNIDIFDFDLSGEDIEKLNALDKGESGRIFDFLFFKGVENHPEYPFKNRLQGWW